MNTAPDPSPSTSPAASPGTDTPAARARRRRALIFASALVVLGTILFATGAVAKLRDRAHPDPRLLGVAAWQIATAGFVCTLAGGLWLRRHVA